MRSGSAWRSAASAEVGACVACGVACGVRAAGAAGWPSSEEVSVPQAAAPKMTAAMVAMAPARAEYRRRRPVVLVFMAFPLDGWCSGVWVVVTAAAATADSDI